MTDETERVDLDSLYANRLPPAELEERVVEGWRESPAGGPPPRRSEWRPGYRVAAGVVLFLAGWGAARLAPSSGSEATPHASFMLLLWEGPDFAHGSGPGDLAPEYAAWAREVAAGGVPLSGEELGPERVWIGRNAGRPTPDSRVGGYFLVDVPDEATARRLAEDHPHVRHGGWVEVARVVTPQTGG